ncbi:hypothetical protein PINS_up000339 [Pythium insidiosum]|nr:hypothetical protein PINS_up000339 [Pythium insidiosum]
MYVASKGYMEWVRQRFIIIIFFSSVTPFSLDANLIEQAASPAERDTFSQTDEFVRFVSPKKKVATADGVFQRPKVGVDSGHTDRVERQPLRLRPRGQAAPECAG